MSPVRVSVYTRLRNSIYTHRCRAPSLRKPLLLLRVSSDIEVAMVSISVLLIVLGEKHPKWAYCNLENSLGTLKHWITMYIFLSVVNDSLLVAIF